MAQLNFDASQVAPSEGALGPVPAGWYNVAIEKSDMKPAKAAGNFYLQLVLSIIDGQYLNRKIFVMLNLVNNNPVAQEIAYKDLSAICHAVGVLQVPDSSVLHGRPFKVKVTVSPATAEHEAGNNVRAFKNINEKVDQVPAAGVAAPAAPWNPAAAGAGAAAPAPAWAPPPVQQAAPVNWAPPAQQPPVQQAAPAWAPPVQQAAPVQAAAPAWTPPAAQQPWAAPAQQAPAQQPPQQPPVQQVPVQAPQTAQAAQQPSAPAVPAWMTPAAAATPGAAPAWATQPQA